MSKTETRKRKDMSEVEKEREDKGKNEKRESGKIGVHARRCCGHTW